jgi:seryl-tRNA synthetase
MNSAQSVVHQLKRRGQLWEHAPGLYALRGDALRLYRRLERLIAREAARMAHGQEWLTPSAITLETLARADYFESFPQWLSMISHLSERDEDLEAVARAPRPDLAAAHAALPPTTALPPAMCYHVYAALAGRTLRRGRRMTVQGTCWRHEGAVFEPLARGWAFTMREVVQLGGQLEVELFRQQGMRMAVALAAALGLDAQLNVAADPFFAPTARGKALLQRVKALKHELLLPIGDRSIAAASFNHHETFFGDAFDIAMASKQSAHSGCVAFGIERWLLAYLVRHGVESTNWNVPRRLGHETAKAKGTV